MYQPFESIKRLFPIMFLCNFFHCMYLALMPLVIMGKVYFLRYLNLLKNFKKSTHQESVLDMACNSFKKLESALSSQDLKITENLVAQFIW